MSVMPNLLERYRRMKKENKSYRLWSRTLVMCECKVLPDSESGCWCDSSRYGMLSWMVLSTACCSPLQSQQAAPSKSWTSTGWERNTRALVVPSLYLYATTTSFSSTNILPWSVPSEQRPETGSSSRVKRVPGTHWYGMWENMPWAVVACLGPSCMFEKLILSTLGKQPKVAINVIHPPPTP